MVFAVTSNMYLVVLDLLSEEKVRQIRVHPELQNLDENANCSSIPYI